MKVTCNACAATFEIAPPPWVLAAGRPFRMDCARCGSHQEVFPTGISVVEDGGYDLPSAVQESPRPSSSTPAPDPSPAPEAEPLVMPSASAGQPRHAMDDGPGASEEPASAGAGPGLPEVVAATRAYRDVLTDPGRPRPPSAPTPSLLLRQEGALYHVPDLATLQRWIVEKRVGADDEVSVGSDGAFVLAGQEPTLAVFFETVSRLDVFETQRVDALTSGQRSSPSMPALSAISMVPSALADDPTQEMPHEPTEEAPEPPEEPHASGRGAGAWRASSTEDEEEEDTEESSTSKRYVAVVTGGHRAIPAVAPESVLASRSSWVNGRVFALAATIALLGFCAGVTTTPVQRDRWLGGGSQAASSAVAVSEKNAAPAEAQRPVPSGPTDAAEAAPGSPAAAPDAPTGGAPVVVTPNLGGSSVPNPAPGPDATTRAVPVPSATASTTTQVAVPTRSDPPARVVAVPAPVARPSGSATTRSTPPSPAAPPPMAHVGPPAPSPNPVPSPTTVVPTTVAPAASSPAPGSAPGSAPTSGGPRIDQLDHDALIEAGWKAVEAKDFTTGVLAFERATALRPDSYEARYGYGYGLLKKGRTSEAKPHLCYALSTSSRAGDRQEIEGILRASGLTCQ